MVLSVKLLALHIVCVTDETRTMEAEEVEEILPKRRRYNDGFLKRKSLAILELYQYKEANLHVTNCITK